MALLLLGDDLLWGNSGGGGLTGTTADYMRFCEMLRRGGELDGARIVGPRTLAMMHMNHLKDGQDLTQTAIGAFSETSNSGVGFGLGFAMVMDQVAGHGENETMVALRQRLAADSRLHTSFLQVGDGVSVSVKRAS